MELVDRLAKTYRDLIHAELPRMKSLASYATSGWHGAAVSDDHVSEAISATAAEVNLVEQFIALADNVGLPIPGNSFVTTESYLFRIRSGTQVTVAEEGAEWLSPQIDGTFGLAQHHGVPTRLLDFSRNPLIAGFFAAHDEKKGNEIAVWGVDTSKLESCERVRILTCRRYENSFLHAQDGLFLWDTKATAAFAREGCWPSLDSILREAEKSTGDNIITKLTLASNQTERLLRILWRERVSLPYLMPTYDNIGKSLRPLLDLSERSWQ